MPIWNKEIEKNLNSIVDLKKQWNQADYNNDDAERKKIAANAQQYYNNLVGLGRSDIADKLNRSNYEQAVQYQNKLKTTGKTDFRPYMYSLGKNANMSQADVDALISWDNDTKEITFAGKKIGSPDEIIDGKSYFSDTSVLDNAFSDYQQRTGNYNVDNMANSDEAYISQGRKKDYDFAYSNPFESDVGKELMSGVQSEMTNAGNNALASEASTNSGNIDSFAAANAARQKEAVLNSRKRSVLDWQQQVLNNAESILNNMGLDNTRRITNYETRANGDVNRNLAIAGITGVIPKEYARQSNVYFNDDGTALLNPETDYQQLINDYVTSKYLSQDSEITQQEINSTVYANLEDDPTLRQLVEARNFKTTNYDDYKQYANTNYAYTPRMTQSAKEFLGNMGVSKYKIDKEAEADNYAANMDYYVQGLKNQGNLDVQNLKNQNNLDVQGLKNQYNQNKDLETEAAKTIKSFVDAFNKGKEKNIILIDGSGLPYFNPSLTEEEIKGNGDDIVGYISEISGQLYSTPNIDDDLKQIIIQQLTPYHSPD